MSSRKKRREAPAVNAGSMADIAFLLLIFFLVTTTILDEQGVLVRLPIWDPVVESTPLNQDKVLTVKINKENALLVESELAELKDIPRLVKKHVINTKFSPKEAIVSITHDRGTSYETYLQVYDVLLLSYRQLRNERAQAQFGKLYEQLSQSDQLTIRTEIPLIISEAEPTVF